jgi:hypothetical protein
LIGVKALAVGKLSQALAIDLIEPLPLLFGWHAVAGFKPRRTKSLEITDPSNPMQRIQGVVQSALAGGRDRQARRHRKGFCEALIAQLIVQLDLAGVWIVVAIRQYKAISRGLHCPHSMPAARPEEQR